MKTETRLHLRAAEQLSESSQLSDDRTGDHPPAPMEPTMGVSRARLVEDTPRLRLPTGQRRAHEAGRNGKSAANLLAGDHRIVPGPTVSIAPGFSRDQLRKLVRDVDATHVQSRELDGKRLSYIEGWYAIAQANAIFGHAGWDREMVHFERVMERTRGDAIVVCGYMARVRIRVRAGSTEVIREGTGWGSASASTATAANERALKAAETDATKRALSTFGASFGLSLYDKDHVPAKPRPLFTLFAPEGRALADSLSPEAYCTGLRQLIEISKDTHQLDQLSRHNRASLADLRIQVPTLRSAQGVHFADLLLRLMRKRREKLSGAAAAHNPSAGATEADGLDQKPAIVEGSGGQSGKTHAPHGDIPPGPSSTLSGGPPHPGTGQQGTAAPEVSDKSAASILETPAPAPTSKIAFGLKIDKSRLLLGLERRIRDKAHLRRVAELPCLVCNRQPSHAHHLRFAQRRGLSQKVSDEYVVPLCALHHGDLHRSSSEQEWWKRQRIEPMAIAQELWAKHH